MADESGPPASGPDDDSGVRISEEQRQDALQRLRSATVDGLLSLDQFGDRTAAALVATTRGELAPLVADLPARDQPVRTDGVERGLIVGILGGGDRTGRWRLPRKCLVINAFGGADLDLSGATVNAATSTITVLSVFGGSDIYVPSSVDVDAGGFAILGGNDVHLDGLEPEPGAPVVKIRAYSLFGGTDVSVRHSP